MFKYAIINLELIKSTNLGIYVFPDESILGIVKARSRKAAIALAKEITGIEDLNAIATGSSSLSAKNLEIALSKPVLGCQNPTVFSGCAGLPRSSRPRQ